MLITTMCFWDTSTNTFHLPCGMITLTLFEIVIIVVLRPTREAFEPPTKTRKNHGFTFTRTTYSSFIKDHQASTDRVDAYEHIDFLTYWLSMYFLCARSAQMAKKYVPLATQLHEGRKVCLNRLILCGMYESLGLVSQDLKKMANPDSL